MNVETLKENILADDICAEYSAQVAACINKKQLFDVALSRQGAQYVCEQVAKGSIITPQVIETLFSSFLNGQYVRRGEYSSAIYLKFKETIECNTDLLVLINCDVEVVLPPMVTATIFIVGCNRVKIESKQGVYVQCFGKQPDVLQGNIKRLKTKDDE